MVQFVLGLPLLVLIVVLGVIVFASAAGGLASGDDIGIAAGSAGLCIVMPVLLIAVIAGAFLIGLIAPVALRYGVLNDITFGQAIKRAWDDLWAKKGVFVFWLVMLLPGMAYAAIAMVLVIPAAIAIMMLAIAGQVIIAMMVGFFLVLLMLVPNAIYATFVNAAWTLFFRQMTGMEPLRAAVTPGGPQYPAAPTTYAPAAYAPGPVVEVAAPAEMPAETPVAYDAPAIGTSTTEEPPPSDG